MPKNKKPTKEVKNVADEKEFVECPECKGKDEGCSMCGGRGTVLKE